MIKTDAAELSRKESAEEVGQAERDNADGSVAFGASIAFGGSGAPHAPGASHAAGVGPSARTGLPASATRSTDTSNDPNLLAQRLRYLNEIGLALSAERNIGRLLKIILSKSRELTSSDAGSLYLIEKTKGSDGQEQRTLFFNYAENDTVTINLNKKFSVSPASLAGYAALTGQALCFPDVYDLPPNAPYKFDPTADRENHYRTKSVLVLPLKNHQNEVIGVLQLINRKRKADVTLHDEIAVEDEVVPFDDELIEVCASLASQAAVALENSIQLDRILGLLRNREELLESFVKASSAAIEDRDPSTSGHSQRVTILTIGLAQAANDATEGPFANVHFSPHDLKELQYAGLLHDIGKISVREYILTKSHKLEPKHFQNVQHRLALLCRELQLQCAEAKIALLSAGYTTTLKQRLSELDASAAERIRELENYGQTLSSINDPTMTHLPTEIFERNMEVVTALAGMEYTDQTGQRTPLLNKDEVEALSVRRGSLTQWEHDQIKHHAERSYVLLREIHWTDEYSKVPHIAHMHHEKMNGGGYPRGLVAAEISMQARMMTVADIYDALTASDRAYKKAAPLEKALNILREEANEGALDADVVNLFIDQQIYKLTEGWRPIKTRRET